MSVEAHLSLFIVVGLLLVAAAAIVAGYRSQTLRVLYRATTVTSRRPEIMYFDIALRERGLWQAKFGLKLFIAMMLITPAFSLAAALAPETMRIGGYKVAFLSLLASIICSLVSSYVLRTYLDLPPRHSRTAA